MGQDVDHEGEYAIEQELTARIARDPRSPLAWFNRAQWRFQGEHYEAALDDLDRVLQCGLDNAEVRRMRGRCHDKLFVYEEIATDYSRVLDFLPDDGEAFFERGNALHNLGELELALVDYSRAIQHGVTQAKIFVYRAQVQHDLDHSKESAEDLAQGLEKLETVDDADWCHTMGHYWHNCGQADVSARFFAQAIRIEPDIERHYNCGIDSLLDLERDAEIQAYEQQIERIKLGDEPDMSHGNTPIYPLVREHHGEAALEELNVTQRTWPLRAAADLQRAFDSLESAGFAIRRFHSTQKNGRPPEQFSQVYDRDRRNPVVAVAPQYLEIDIGEEAPVRALKDGLWLLQRGETALTVLLYPDYNGINLFCASATNPTALSAVQDYFRHIENAISRSECYRGKILSLEQREMYNGQGLGILVHRLKSVSRDEVILPRRTLDLLDRNVLQFVMQHERLAAFGLATKKGLLFYGPPGTGKTHTLHYLARGIPGHTTFLISAEQVCNLSEYMTLARLLQPSMVVIEDVDLIARDRADMRSAGEEVLLNKLLNEMDGLQPDSQILFVLTTNRPVALEDALASRPGRVDQAIEFPLPDPEGRAKLMRLYARGIALNDDVLEHAVKRTENVSASFIKELLRRAIQFALFRTSGTPEIVFDDIDKALEELLITGGSLNRKLLGADAWNRSVEVGTVS